MMRRLYRTVKRVINHWNEFGHEFGFEEVINDLEKVILMTGFMPRIVCLCGSTRFSQAFQEANLKETLAGRIVLSIGCDLRSDKDIFTNMTKNELDKTKERLDELHLRKIDLADEVLILNVGGYIGESTARELAYAKQQGKLIRFLEATQ